MRISKFRTIIILSLIILTLTPTSFRKTNAIIDSEETHSVSSIERDWNDMTLLFEGQYHNYDQLVEEIENIETLVPNLIQVEVIGNSYLGNEIYSIRITNEETSTQKAKALVVAHHHGREQVTIEIALRFIIRLVNMYGIDENITKYIDTEEIYVIPTLNPDSLEQVVEQGNHWLRKNLRPFDDDEDGRIDEDPPQDVDGDGIISSFDVYLKDTETSDPIYSYSWFEGIDDDLDGIVNEDPIGLVDLNRNYDVFWNPSGALTDPLSGTYAGEFAFSEPETQAMRDFMSEHKFAMAYSLHTGINATFMASDGAGNFAEDPLYPNILNDYIDILPDSFNAAWSYDGRSMTARNLATLTGNGVWRDWMYHEQRTMVPIGFEIYTNATSHSSEIESVYLENETHLILEWEGIFGIFNPDDEYIQSLWIELIPSFDYLLEMTPRIEIHDPVFIVDDVEPDIINIQFDVECIGRRISTLDPVGVYLENGIKISESLEISPHTNETIAFDLSLATLQNDILVLNIGNEFVGYHEIIYQRPLILAPIIIVIIVTGILVVVLVLYSRR